MDKLTVIDAERMLTKVRSFHGTHTNVKNEEFLSIIQHLTDTMHENDRLLNAFKYGHQCLINAGFSNLAELMAMTAGRHNGNPNKEPDNAKD